MKLEIHKGEKVSGLIFGENYGFAQIGPKYPKNGPFQLYFKFQSLLLAENILKCASYCRKSGKTIHMSRKILVLKFLGLKLSANQIAGFFKWLLQVNRLIFFSETLHEVVCL